MLRKGMFLADRYEILEQIGTGGMSDVYKAKCHKLNRYVAIKVLKHEFSEDKNFVSKFRDEARSAAGLAYPNIVNVYDVGDENGIYYIVMELVEGITLKKYIEKRERIPYKEAASIAIQVAKGIDAAHKHHIIHRDIKPQNIIISKDGKVKVTDFGIAKAASSSTVTSSAMGSVHYISPEQARGGYSDERSDIYSFGITFYEMLTGKVPFDGDTTVAVAVQHIQDSIPAPSSMVADIPISIDKIVLKCTQKKVDMRYQSAAELIIDLKKALVMPDEDFVQLAPMYGAVNTDEAESYDGDESYDILDDEMSEDKDLLDDEDIEESNDIDDEDNDKLDKAMKWIGIGIAVVIVIIAIFVVVKFIGGSSGGNNQEESSTEVTTQSENKTDDDNSVTVPKVSGMSEEEAKEALNDVNLGYKPTYENSDTVDAGKVISQSPAAGKQAKKNETIILKISSGPEDKSASVPEITGKTENDATNAIKNAGFKVNVNYEYSDTVASGNVISQNPSGTADKGETITIVVSRGKQVVNVTVPNVTGYDEDSAKQLIEGSGLKVSVKTVPSNSVAKGNVIVQDHPANSSVAKDTVITITVSSGPSVSNATEGTKSPTEPATSGSGESDKGTSGSKAQTSEKNN